ncbi:MAG: PD-(D/E)XK nuclease family protein [Nostoc sp. JL31]|uniref:PD-(D/E)XK nuclease family protein n=1 Tax=Nostoc sp. JL31 TaxID=2815395 RepID=UPI0025F75B87|nr:PD-(D/E)XK nuclease family protein [Nostoc sp. JL31]MBN3890258.1 PD-(D/E)XK nuclease family protein [Nostoc sp. JL31]
MSLFTNLLNLHSGNKPREDFFTEIVAYFLSLKKDILIDWLKHHSIISDDNYSSVKISTQQEHKRIESHTEDSRLDIVVELSTGLTTDVIFIESKIGSTAGWGQLEKYADILSKLENIRHRILIYITRDYDCDPKPTIKEYCLELSPKINFFQLRWYQFYSFLEKCAFDILAQEILIFMRNNRMAHNNHLSSIDILTMVNFNKTLNFIEATLNDEVKKEFKQAFEGVNKAELDSLYQWKSKNRYIIGTSFSIKRWAFWCGLGYFDLNPSNLTDYPYLGIFLQVSPNFGERPKIIESMQKVINDKPNIWTPANLTILPAWSAIFYQRSLQEFLSEKDQLSAIKLFFQESIEELKTVQKQYFNFPCKGVSIEEITETDKEEDLDTSPSFIASL